MEDFLTIMKEENNHSITENGALGFRSTGTNLVDLNFSVSSLRGMEEVDIINRFMKAYFEDGELAVRWLFYLRDIQEGLGERRIFRVILNHLAHIEPELIKRYVTYIGSFTLEHGPIIPYFGRWDDLDVLFDTIRQVMIAFFIKR